MKLNKKIFKAYDIRGRWNEDWDKNSVYKIGLALFKQFTPKKVSIGRDARHSSDDIFNSLSQALLDCGVEVLDLGLCSTELTYFSTTLDIDLSLMITASHNPPKDNGLKVTLKGALTVGLNTGLDKVRDLCFTDIQLSKNKGSIKKLDLWDKYKKHIFKLANIDSTFSFNKKIVIDAANGMGGYTFDKVLSSLRLNIVKMFWDLDGSFPNHPADPFREENTTKLKSKVLTENATLGISLDGDSDRIFFIDEKGRYIPGYYIAAILSEYMLKKSNEKETIIHDPRYYWATVKVIKDNGGIPIKSKVGHTLIKESMRKNNSLFSAECSGHIFYRENNFAESSMLTILNMLKIIQTTPLSLLTDSYFKNYPISGEINFIVDDNKSIMNKLQDEYSNGKIDFLDGISIEFNDWRFNVRTSNTQPLLRLNLEAKNQELLDKKIEEMKWLIGGTITNH